MRGIRISRDEAEFIVEACERDGSPQWFDLQDDLRKQWGMVARALDYSEPARTAWPEDFAVWCRCGAMRMQGPSPWTWWVGKGGTMHSHDYCGPYNASA